MNLNDDGNIDRGRLTASLPTHITIIDIDTIRETDRWHSNKDIINNSG